MKNCSPKRFFNFDSGVAKNASSDFDSEFFKSQILHPFFFSFLLPLLQEMGVWMWTMESHEKCMIFRE